MTPGVDVSRTSDDEPRAPLMSNVTPVLDEADGIGATRVFASASTTPN